MREHREITGTVEGNIKGADKDSVGNIADRIEIELAALGASPDHRAGRRQPERCEGCGGLKHERDQERNADRVCRCGGRKRRLLSYLDAVDPGRRMTLESLDVSDGTIYKSSEQARRIVSGERKRGMLLMGLPGRGKTHLMLGMRWALLDRDRDARYYNVEEHEHGIVISTAGTVSDRMRPGRASSFNIVEVEEENLHVTTHSWKDGSGFVASRKASFPRKPASRAS